MKEWFVGFWKKHGERTIFISWLLILATIFMFIPELKDLGISIFGMIAGILLNKARSPENKKD